VPGGGAAGGWPQETQLLPGVSRGDDVSAVAVRGRDDARKGGRARGPRCPCTPEVGARARAPRRRWPAPSRPRSTARCRSRDGERTFSPR